MIYHFTLYQIKKNILLDSLKPFGGKVGTHVEANAAAIVNYVRNIFFIF